MAEGDRRLSALMLTDIVGFTALTQRDEAAALRLLDEHRQLVRPLLSEFRGREVKTIGDAFLVEFTNALDATRCAVAIQRSLRERNARTPGSKMEVRIGLHVGDVELRDGDIFGDAVNIVSRVEPMAEAGGICVSEDVRNQVRNKVGFPLEPLGSPSLKNIEFPVSLYRLELPWNRPQGRVRGSSLPRLAVLPFSNISPDPNDAYFADGLTEELISVLSQLPELRVIARTSVIGYKSQPKPVAQIGAELDTDSLLEGTVRKVGDQLRITVQLVDVPSQEHTWAHSYDRTLRDVFAVQSEIAREVASALEVKLRPADDDRLSGRRPVRSDSYLAYLKGRTLLNQRSEASMHAAKEAFETAIALDASNAAAYSGLSDVTRLLGVLFRERPLAEWDEPSRAFAARALELDPNLAEAHTSLGFCLWSDYDYAAAEQRFTTAVALNPSYADARHWYAGLLSDQRRLEEAESQVVLAEEADPRSPAVLADHVILLVRLRRLDEARALIDRLEAIDSSRRIYHGVRLEYLVAQNDLTGALHEVDRLDEIYPGHPEHRAARAMLCAGLGRTDEAKQIVRELEALPAEKLPSSGIAGIYACLHDLDACFRWLEKSAFESFDLEVGGWRYDPRWEAVRQDPRFDDLLLRMNLH